MTRDPEREKDWNRHEWAGSTGDQSPVVDTPGDTWNKAEWVGDQGEGAPLPIPREAMPEGETAISGNRHPVGEQHWAGAAKVRERTDGVPEPASDSALANGADRPLDESPLVARPDRA